MNNTPSALSRQAPRDVFLYLLMIFVLASSAISFGVLVFQFINLFIVDVADAACRYDSCHDAIRRSLAFLVIVFPVLLWVTRFLHRDVKAAPAKKELWIRRWLLYMTLFVAGVIVIGDLVALVNGYLQGELTARFILKVLTVLFIAASVFYYYLKELQVAAAPAVRVLGRVVVLVVTIAIVAGFIIAGSPSQQRERKIDGERVADLQMIQSQLVDRFWTSKGRLPSALAELEDDISGFSVPVDPVTADPYEYTRVNDVSFRLCATFTTASGEFEPVARRLLLVGENWEYEEGRTCFDRTIDPEQYRPLEEVKVL